MNSKLFKNGIVFNAECLKTMDNLINRGVKCNAIITDIPYGTTACKWDNIIPFDSMWQRLNQLCLDEHTPILLFAQQPFTSLLVASNINNYKFQWYYKKLIASNFASAKYQPMKHIEDICVFTKNNGVVNYYPIMQERAEGGKKRLENPYHTNSATANETMNNMARNNAGKEYDKELKFPENIQTFNNRAKGQRGLHPTQKPVELMEYLIKSHTKENELVLDFTMGSGTTCVACQNTKRKFIGIELDKKYYDIAVERLQENENNII